MNNLKKMLFLTIIGVVAVSVSHAASNKVTLVLGAYTAPREALKKIIPLFQEKWRKETGQEVVFKESYLGSGAQSRAIAEGFEADLALLAMEPDLMRLVKKGLITHDWKEKEGGMITRSVVALAVRAGNPKKVSGWEELSTQDLELLTPNPKTSGGAQWNLLAAYGAIVRGKVEGYEANEAGARRYLIDFFRRVTVLDKGARESIINYENGNGDLAVTYESEVWMGRLHGATYEAVIPRSTVLIENPAAVVDQYVDKHGTRAIAEAFLEFLYSVPAQQIFAENGYRPVDPEVAHAFEKQFPPVEDLWPIEFLGNWKEIGQKFFAPKGIYEQVMEEVQKQK